MSYISATFGTDSRWQFTTIFVQTFRVQKDIKVSFVDNDFVGGCDDVSYYIEKGAQSCKACECLYSVAESELRLLG